MTEIDKIIQGDRRAAARLITRIENKEPSAIESLKALHRFTGRAHIVGITGPPGAGKSTLTDKLVKVARQQDLKVGVIAVDPTSPFTGGAILGDRVRMGDLATDSGVFIRSMGARGHLGGISEATSSAVKVLDAYGCDLIFVETVGVGQSEIDIVQNCDTTVIVMVPGLGDDIQAIKAGIMEVGDLFVVNKADRDGVQRTIREIESMLDFNALPWRPPVLAAIAVTGVGMETVYEAIFKHQAFMKAENLYDLRRQNNIKEELINMTKQRVTDHLMGHTLGREKVVKLAEQVARRELDPISACDQLFNEFL